MAEVKDGYTRNVRLPMIARVGDDYFISVIGDGDVVWILEATVVAPEPSK